MEKDSNWDNKSWVESCWSQRNALLDPLWLDTIYLWDCRKFKDPNGEVWCITVLVLYECFLEHDYLFFDRDCFWSVYTVTRYIIPMRLDVTSAQCASSSVLEWHSMIVHSSLRGVSWTYSSAVTLLYTHVCWACMLDDKLHWHFSKWSFGVRLDLVCSVWLYGQLARDQS